MSIVKKGEEEKVEEYRGVTWLQCTRCMRQFWQGD